MRPSVDVSGRVSTSFWFTLIVGPGIVSELLVNPHPLEKEPKSEMLTFAPRVRSRVVSLGAGIAAGGALATLAAGATWSGVPDPLVRGGVAFNLADLAIVLGDALLIGGALRHAVRNRDRLRESVL